MSSKKSIVIQSGVPMFAQLSWDIVGKADKKVFNVFLREENLTLKVSVVPYWVWGWYETKHLDNLLLLKSSGVFKTVVARLRLNFWQPNEVASCFWISDAVLAVYFHIGAFTITFMFISFVVSCLPRGQTECPWPAKPYPVFLRLACFLPQAAKPLDGSLMSRCLGPGSRSASWST